MKWGRTKKSRLFPTAHEVSDDTSVCFWLISMVNVPTTNTLFREKKPSSLMCKSVPGLCTEGILWPRRSWKPYWTFIHIHTHIIYLVPILYLVKIPFDLCLTSILFNLFLTWSVSSVLLTEKLKLTYCITDTSLNSNGLFFRNSFSPWSYKSAPLGFSDFFTF